MGPWARTHGPQGLPARGRRAGGRRRGSPWGPWARAHGPMGPGPWVQAHASGVSKSYLKCQESKGYPKFQESKGYPKCQESKGYPQGQKSKGYPKGKEAKGYPKCQSVAPAVSCPQNDPSCPAIFITAASGKRYQHIKKSSTSSKNYRKPGLASIKSYYFHIE